MSLDFHEGADDGVFPAPPVPNGSWAFATGIMRYFVYDDPDWSYVDYDFDRLKEDSKQAAEILNATNPDLSAFRKRGGKLIIYSGWSDAAVPGAAVVGYHDAVLAHDVTAAEDARLFMMPGVEHCFGGPGPSWVDFLDEIDNWVESGEAPDQIIAYWLDENTRPTGSRPVCAYPDVARYDGKGDPREASSFRCAGGG